MLPVSEAASLERLPTQVWHLNDPQRATSAERRHPPKGAASKTAHEISTALRGGGEIGAKVSFNTPALRSPRS